jgi:uncharacterized RDD family membrane protein YckC
MQNDVRFETPENVQVRYEPAGLGTRFVAWFVDILLLIVGFFLLAIALVAAGASFEVVDSAFGDDASGGDDNAMYYFVGILFLVWGLGTVMYFGFSELCLGGQTIGKRASKLRVIKSNGFQLDASSILVRNLFRVVDNLPPMWLFPLLSRLHQRSGDMVAGTLVVFDSTANLSTIRTALSTRTAAEAQFRFDASQLKRLGGSDFLAIERVLERLPTMADPAQAELLQIYVTQICKKLGIDAPALGQDRRFLEDLFAAELRRQDRALA